ncbi:ABC transporter permease [Dactylosporangium sp. CA-233914]|uniref:ABC transporter permease n=1 Tax=Dactylosporangium sp. CA-233914 TaxID=3239934 RepID=UPI003D8A2ECE
MSTPTIEASRPPLPGGTGRHVLSLFTRLWDSDALAVLVLRRLLYGALTVLAVLCIVFLMSHAIGDPATLMLPPEASQEQVDALRTQLGLDQPLWSQFLDSMSGWLRGDFGDSTWRGVPALPLALSAFAKTAYLAEITVLIAVPLGVVLGLVAGRRPHALADRLVTSISAIGVSIPAFWLGLVLILVFAVTLRLLPTNGYGGLSYAILPACAMALLPMGRVAQITRSSVSEEMGRLYVTAARTRGVSEGVIARRHVLRNAAIPILTLVGSEVASLLNGIVIVEVIFSWPGIGRMLIGAIEQRDLPLITASVAVIATVAIVVNILVDIAYLFADPKVRR